MKIVKHLRNTYSLQKHTLNFVTFSSYLWSNSFDYNQHLIISHPTYDTHLHNSFLLTQQYCGYDKLHDTWIIEVFFNSAYWTIAIINMQILASIAFYMQLLTLRVISFLWKHNCTCIIQINITHCIYFVFLHLAF